MGVVENHVSPHGAGKQVAILQNKHAQNEEREINDSIVGEVQGLSEEEESNMNEIVQDLNNVEVVDDVPLGEQDDGQNQLQMLNGPMISWEKFLPVRTLKVLLVESDNSTRQVVTALLRNCGYEVSAVADGQQAWKILDDLMNHIDIILTEVVMPYLCGISLLNKIMNHETCKNIPVIMMSSNDSMGTVFKCLSKGAVDFLVKPVRKNELKNLWQHVWRRCQSSSGSGSESGIQTQKSVKSKKVDESDNNSGSNDDNGSTDLNAQNIRDARDGSDDGSGTQSSWTKRAVEVESPKRTSRSDQLADPHDSTCAQVIRPKPEGSCNDWVAVPDTEDCKELDKPTDDFMGKDLEIGVSTKPNAEFETYAAEKVCSEVENLPGSDKNECVLGLGGKNALNEKDPQAAGLTGTIPCDSDIQPVTVVNEVLNGYSKAPEGKESVGDGSADVPLLEMSLKRLRSMSNGVTASNDNQSVLRRSEQSAFSRYHTSASNQAPTAYGGSSQLKNSSETIRAEASYYAIFSSSADPLKQGSNGSSDNNDMGSTAKNIFTKPIANKEKTPTTSTVKFVQTSSVFQPSQIRPSTNQQVEKTEDKTKTTAATKEEQGIHQVLLQHNPNNYRHYHAHLHCSQKQKQKQPLLDHDDLSLKDITGTDPHFGSYAFVLPVEGNAANYSINGSNSGSNHGSNGQNASSHTVKVGRTNIESASDIPDRSGSGGGNGSGTGSASGVYQNRLAQREAALKKFRQKRKERNFGKKVRYQSRKRLAEQRPRVRGQFVRQKVHEQANGES